MVRHETIEIELFIISLVAYLIFIFYSLLMLQNIEFCIHMLATN